MKIEDLVTFEVNGKKCVALVRAEQRATVQHRQRGSATARTTFAEVGATRLTRF